jgi:hypothetical protein
MLLVRTSINKRNELSKKKKRNKSRSHYICQQRGARRSSVCQWVVALAST